MTPLLPELGVKDDNGMCALSLAILIGDRQMVELLQKEQNLLDDVDRQSMNEILGKQSSDKNEEVPAESVEATKTNTAETVDDEEFARNREKIMEFNKREQEGTDTADIARMM